MIRISTTKSLPKNQKKYATDFLKDYYFSIGIIFEIIQIFQIIQIVHLLEKLFQGNGRQQKLKAF